MNDITEINFDDIFKELEIDSNYDVKDKSDIDNLRICMYRHIKDVKSLDVYTIKEIVNLTKGEGFLKEHIEKVREQKTYMGLSDKKSDAYLLHEQAWKDLKQTTPYITPFGIFIKRENESFVGNSWTGLVGFDIDKKDNEDIDMNKLKKSMSENTSIVLLCKSTSGNGLRGLIRLKSSEFSFNKDNWSRDSATKIYEKIRDNVGYYLNKTYKITVDKAQFRVHQPWYLTYDPEVYYNSKACELLIDYSRIGLEVFEKRAKPYGLKIFDIINKLKKITKQRKLNFYKESLMLSSLYNGGCFSVKRGDAITDDDIKEYLRECVYTNKSISNEKYTSERINDYLTSIENGWKVGEANPMEPEEAELANKIMSLYRKVDAYINRYDYDGNDYMIIKKDYYKKIRNSNNITSENIDEIYFNKLVRKSRDVLIREIGEERLRNIPILDDFIVKHDYLNWQQVIRSGNGAFWNVSSPLKATPVEGKWPTIEKLLKHVFQNDPEGLNGDHYDLILDYFRISILNPYEYLPIIVLASTDQETGKSSFGVLLSMIFGDNYKLINSGLAKSGFNSVYESANFVFIDESKNYKDDELENVLKSISTTNLITINKKGVDPFSIKNNIKMIMATNDLYTFIRATKHDKRYWVRKLYPIIGETSKTVFFNKIKEEVPAFLYYIINSEIKTKNMNRMWFSEKLYKNKIWDEIVEENKADWKNEVDIVLNSFKQQGYKRLYIHINSFKEKYAIYDSLSNKAFARYIKDEWGGTAKVERYSSCVEKDIIFNILGKDLSSPFSWLEINL